MTLVHTNPSFLIHLFISVKQQQNKSAYARQLFHGFPRCENLIKRAQLFGDPQG